MALLCLLPSGAEAARRYISTSGTATWAACLDNPGTPASLDTANARVAPGDTVQALDGTTYGTIQPNHVGVSGSPVVWLGNPADSSAVQFDGYVSLSGHHSTGPRGYYTHLRWMTLEAVDMGNKSVGGGGNPVGVRGIQIVKCRILDDTVRLVGGDVLVDSVVCPNFVEWDMDNNSSATVSYTNNVTIKNSVFTGTKTGSENWQWLYLTRTQNLVLFNNTITITNNKSGGGYEFVVEAYFCREILLQNNRITYTNNSTGAGSSIVISTRDSTVGFRVIGNAITTNGSKACGIRNSHAGIVSAMYSARVSYIGNIIKIGNPPVTDQGAFELERPSNGDTIMFNVIASGTARPALTTHSAYVPNGVVIRHNTFFTSAAQAISWTTTSGSNVKWASNLVYSTAANSASASGATVRLAEYIAADSMGTIYTPNGSSGNAIYRTTSGLGTPGAGGVFGTSGKAVWGSPRLMDSTYTTLNAGISILGYADNFRAPSLQDGFSGAFSDSLGGSTGTSDVTAPDAVGDLTVAGTGSSDLDLEWTSTGDDAGVGTATTYDIRYSTGTISEGNWGSTTAFTGEPTPLVADQNTSWTTPSVLSPSTTYYIAMKVADEAGNWSALSNVVSATTDAVGDVTAPAAIADLTASDLYTTSADLTWVATGDDGSTGTASVYDIRYSTSTITSGNWASATAFTGEPTPGASGDGVMWTTPEVLSPNTTYYFAMKVRDEVGNESALSNVESGTTDNDDAVRPDDPAITAKYYAPGTAIVTFTAVGDDSLTGTAARYDLRYGLGTAWFPDTSRWSAAGIQGRTYHYDLEGPPKAAGSADTIYVWGLQPGQTYDFMLRVRDDGGLASAHSNRDTVAIPAQTAADTEPYPRIGIYGGAGPVPNDHTYPLVNQAQTALQTAYIDSLSRYPVVSLAPGFTDDSVGTAPRQLAFAAIRRMRTNNPGIKIFGEPLGNVVFVSHRWNADTARAFSYYARLAKALDHATGDSLKYIMSTTGGGQIVANGMDATLSFLIRKAEPTYKHMMWDVARSSSFGGQGNTNSNVDMTDPRVRDSSLAINVRHYVTRVDPQTGAYVYDGIMFDLHQPDFYQASSTEGDTPDYTRLRAGFASRAAFDSAWVQSHNLYMRAFRKACIQAGRPNFILTGNSRSGIASAHMNGWMRENWPLQQGTTWHTNFGFKPGGQVNDAESFGWKPQMSWVFRAYGLRADSLDTDATVYNPDHYQRFRFGMGTAALTGARFVYEPSDAALARAGVLPRWYGAWWFDESAVTSGASTHAYTGVGWLGQPLARYRQTSPLHGSGVGRHTLADPLDDVGDWDDVADTTSWQVQRVANQTLVGRVTDTTYASSAGALRIRVATRQVADYYVGVFGGQLAGPGGRNNYTAGDTLSLEFWAKASSYLPISAGVRDSATGSNILDVSSSIKTWIDTDWAHYRLIGVATTSGSGGPYFWAGDTTGTWWIDEVRLIRGRPRGGLFYREFDSGVVIVNPYSSRDTFTTTSSLRHITGLSGRAASVNAGALKSIGASVPVEASDAIFLVEQAAADVTAPDAVSDLAIAGQGSTHLDLEWTSSGDDGASGTATSYDIRYSTSNITAGNFASATQFTGEPTPQEFDNLEQWNTPAVLAPGTTYYVAMKVVDEEGNTSAISNVVSGATSAASDVIRPAASTISMAFRSWTSVRLAWTAVGDDSLTGTATSYDVRYSTSTINAGNWAAASQATLEPTPSVAGTSTSFTVSGLTPNVTYYFAMKTADEAPNVSALSNVVSTATLSRKFSWLTRYIRILIGRN